MLLFFGAQGCAEHISSLCFPDKEIYKVRNVTHYNVRVTCTIPERKQQRLLRCRLALVVDSLLGQPLDYLSFISPPTKGYLKISLLFKVRKGK